MGEEPLRRVFLAYSLDQLSALIMDQGKAVMRDAGVDFSIRAAPIVLLLSSKGPLAAADVAKALNQPHQLVAQRLDALVELSIIKRVVDSADARRKLLKITEKGLVQLGRLKETLGLLEGVYEQMFEKLGCDLAAKVLEAAEALGREPLLEGVLAARRTREEAR